MTAERYKSMTATWVSRFIFTQMIISYLIESSADKRITHMESNTNKVIDLIIFHAVEILNVTRRAHKDERQMQACSIKKIWRTAH